MERPCDYRDTQRLGVKKSLHGSERYLENLNNWLRRQNVKRIGKAASADHVADANYA
jgi:hypothetical protein